MKSLSLGLRVTGSGIEHKCGLVRSSEVEHGVDDAGAVVEGVVADPTGLPVVLDEPQDRGLVGLAVVDEVWSRIRRDHQEREPRPVATTPLVLARPRDSVTAGARRAEGIHG